MKETRVMLQPLTSEDREAFILENQEAFRYGAREEFGNRDGSAQGDGEIISRETIETCIDAQGNEALRIVVDGEKVGGLIVKIDPQTQHNHLELFFVVPSAHSRGIGYGAWKAVEERYPDTRVWETCTPHFEKRNIHFYINKCGFHAVEFWNRFHPDPHDPDMQQDGAEGEGEDFAMFRFVKVMK